MSNAGRSFAVEVPPPLPHPARHGTLEHAHTHVLCICILQLDRMPAALTSGISTANKRVRSDCRVSIPTFVKLLCYHPLPAFVLVYCQPATHAHTTTTTYFIASLLHTYIHTPHHQRHESCRATVLRRGPHCVGQDRRSVAGPPCVSPCIRGECSFQLNTWPNPPCSSRRLFRRRCSKSCTKPSKTAPRKSEGLPKLPQVVFIFTATNENP